MNLASQNAWVSIEWTSIYSPVIWGIEQPRRCWCSPWRMFQTMPHNLFLYSRLPCLADDRPDHRPLDHTVSKQAQCFNVAEIIGFKTNNNNYYMYNNNYNRIQKQLYNANSGKTIEKPWNFTKKQRKISGTDIKIVSSNWRLAKKVPNSFGKVKYCQHYFSIPIYKFLDYSGPSMTIDVKKPGSNEAMFLFSTSPQTLRTFLLFQSYI